MDFPPGLTQFTIYFLNFASQLAAAVLSCLLPGGESCGVTRSSSCLLLLLTVVWLMVDITNIGHHTRHNNLLRPALYHFQQVLGIYSNNG